jgi:ABC-type dipeptide/oligopeptide/nickel transport system ATPase component
MTLLAINNLHVEFLSGLKKTNVLHGINLSMAKGELHALVGESGSGKSVTGMAIMQLLGAHGRISQGEIWLEGEALHQKDSCEMQKIRGKHISMIFQNPMTALNPTLCVGYQIAEGLIYHEKLSSRQAKKATLDLLADVGIGWPKERYSAYPFQLSGGMCQRIAIAIALAGNPTLLIADEPTTALDATVQAQILQLLQKVMRDRGMSILLITHDLELVAAYSDHVSVMLEGRIVEDAPVPQLFSGPRHPYTRQLLGDNTK